MDVLLYIKMDNKKGRVEAIRAVRLPCYSYNDYRAGWRPLIMDGITGYTYGNRW